MATKPSFMVKSGLGRKVLPCQSPLCTVNTNKRYRANGSKPITACCYRHAETAYQGQVRRLVAVS